MKRISPMKGKNPSEKQLVAFYKMRERHKTPTLGYRFSEESRKKMSEAKKLFIINNPEKWKEIQLKAFTARMEHRLSPEAVLKYNRQRTRYKNLIRRLLNKKSKHSKELLGYGQKEFVKHIESKFRPGMSWSIQESFHIDHIIPVSSFLRRGISDPSVICALSNLQPLFPHENRFKGSKIL